MKNIIVIVAVALFALSCDSEYKAMPKGKVDDMSAPLRGIIAQHYIAPDNFYLGVAGMSEFVSTTPPTSLQSKWLQEFSYITAANAFSQSVVYPQQGVAWTSDNYLKFIHTARRNAQILCAGGAISPQCSAWIMDDTRTNDEMSAVLSTFMTDLCVDLQANRDVVKWMTVVSHTITEYETRGTGYDAAAQDNDIIYSAGSWLGPRKGVDVYENPWTVIGMDDVSLNGESFTIPKYITMAFEIAQNIAPNVKKIYNERSTIEPVVFEQLKKSIAYLRSQNLAVDALGWQAHVDLGWEKDPQNIANMQSVIDWCSENNLEFHITELDVRVSQAGGAIDSQTLESTRNEQAATLGAVVEMMLKNRSKGAIAVNFSSMTDYLYLPNNTVASLFNSKGVAQPSMVKVNELLLKYAQK